MRLFSIALILCLALFTTAFAEEGENMEMQKGTVTITVPAAIKHVEAFTAATAFVKAADYAPEGGWGEKDYDKVFETVATKGFERLANWLNDDRKPAGPFYAIWFDDPAKTPAGDITCKMGVPVEGEPDPSVDVVVEEVPAHDVATLTYMGDYMNSTNAWDELAKFITQEGYTYAGPPREIYIISENETEDPNAWVTEIQWPVKKADAKEQEMMEEPAKAEE